MSRMSLHLQVGPLSVVRGRSAVSSPLAWLGRLLLLVGAMLAVTALAPVQRAQAQEVQVYTPERFDVLPALRDVPVEQMRATREGEEEGEYEVPNKVPPQRFLSNRDLGEDPLRQRSAGAAKAGGAKAVRSDFEGLNNTDNLNVVGGRVAPPDPDVDVGPNHVVEMVNLLLAVYDRSGNLLFGPIPNNGVFAGFGGDCEFDNTGDVIVLYDDAADRWLVSHMSFGGDNPGTECVAISQTGDPTGAYYRYEFVISTTANNDYPKLGVGDDAYYSSYNMFPTSGGYGGVQLAAMERDAMLAGDPNARLLVTAPIANDFSLMPFDIDGPLPTTDVPGYFISLGFDALNLYTLDVDWSGAGSATLGGPTALAVAPFDTQLCGASRGACIPQPNGEALEAIADRPMQRLQFRDMGNDYAMVVAHTVDADGAGTAGVRWYELRDTGKTGAWSVEQQGTYAPDDGLSRWMGSASMNARGDIAVLYTASGPNPGQEPSIRVAGRTAESVPGTLPLPEDVVIQSTTSQVGTARWGDYAALVPDPTDDSFWLVHQYADDAFASLNWTTRIANVAFDPEDTTPPDAITDLAATPNTAEASMTLTWTAPADDAGDPASGGAEAYDLRFSTSGPIDANNFGDATSIATDEPLAAGQAETLLVEGLAFGTEYWFAIRAIDDNANASLSNTASATTTSAPEAQVSPTTLGATLDPFATTTVETTISNTGTGADLAFAFPAFAAQALMAQPGVRLNDTSRPIAGSATHAKGDDVFAGRGTPVTLGAGGSNEDGYVWIDSDEPGGPTFQWEDISTDPNAQELTLGADEGQTVPLPFPFPFYGQDKTEVSVGSNGYLTFGPQGSDFSNDPIPTDTAPNDLIAPFWDDLRPPDNGTIHVLSDGANGRFIAQWTDVPEWTFDNSAENFYTFQAILFDDGSIRYQYLAMDDVTGATIGIENADATEGLQIAFNTDYAKANLAVDIVPVDPPFVTDVSPFEGSIPAGSSQPVTLTLDATSIAPGTYTNDVGLTTNAPNLPTGDLAVNLTVNATAPRLTVEPASLDYGDVFRGQTATQTITVRNTGSATLDVTGITSDDAAFSATPSTFTLAFDEAQEVEVTFAPGAATAFTATLTIASNDPDGDATVPLSGTGIEPPVASLTPTTFDAALETGTSTQETLTIANTGTGVPLDYDVLPVLTSFDPPAMTAFAPTAPARTLPADAAGLVASAPATPRGGGAKALDPGFADAFSYQFDDGSSENGIGLGEGGSVMWLNAFEVADGAGIINAISTQWGSVAEGTPAELFIYDDPNNDGDPIDAVLLTTTPTTVAAPETGTFTVEAITPTPVEGVFFAAALVRDQADEEFPAPADEDGTVAGASWLAGDGSSFDETDLGNNGLPPGQPGVDFLSPANFIIRANGAFATVVPFSGSVDAGQSDDVAVTIDADGLIAGTYAADLRVRSNDPVTPEATATVTLDVSGDPEITADPASVAFGDVVVGAEARATVRLRNDGTAPLTIADVTLTGDAFSFATGEALAAGTLAPGEEATGTVAFAPSAEGAATGTINVTSDDADEGTLAIALTGNGLPAPTLSLAPTSFDESIVAGATAERTLGITNTGGSALDFTLASVRPAPTAPTAPEDVVASMPEGFTLGEEEKEDPRGSVSAPAAKAAGPLPLAPAIDDFTYRLDDGTAETNFTFAPEPEDILWMNAYEAVSPDAVVTALATSFGLVPNGTPARILLYNDPNDDGDPADAELLVSVETTVANSATDAFVVEPIVPTPVDGVFFVAGFVTEPGGDNPAPLDTDSALGAAWFFASPAGTFDFEALDANPNVFFDGGLGSYLVRADGAGIVQFDPVSGTVAPGTTTDVAVTFDATGLVAGLFEGDIVVDTNDPTQQPQALVPYTLDVTGAPEITPDPASLDFGDVFVGAEAAATARLRNDGTAPLTIADVTLTGDAFSFATGEALAAGTLAPGEEATGTVLFAPTAAEAATGEITITSDDADEGTLIIALAGNGTPPPIIAVSPNTIPPLTLDLPETAEQIVTVTNQGSGDLEFTFGIDQDGPSMARVDVAAPAPADAPTAGAGQLAGQNVNVEAAASGAKRAPDAFVYQVDDGSSETFFSLNGDPNDVMWMNAFRVVEGAGTITELATTFGTEFVNGNPVPGALDGLTATLFLYEDPNDDANPADAELLVSTEVTITGSGQAVFNEALIPPTEVQGVFFVAALVTEPTTGVSPAPLDRSTTASSSWFIAGPAGSFDAATLTNNGFGPFFLEGGNAGNWLLRADGAFATIVPASGTVTTGADLAATLTFDTGGILAGTYTGSVVVSSNDPNSPVVEVPYEVTVVSESEQPEAEESIQQLLEAGGNATLAFSGVGVTIDAEDVDLSGNAATRTVTAQRFGSAPGDVTGITETNVSPYRWIIGADGFLAFGPTTTFTFDLAALPAPGVTDASGVVVYHRSSPGTGTFAPMTPAGVSDAGTPGDPSDDRITVTGVTRLGEFVFASNDNPLPVELATFTGQAAEEGVRLVWQTASETNNAGFDVQRQIDGRGAWQTIGSLDGVGTTTEAQTYTFTDQGVPFTARRASYRLRQVDLDGTPALLDPIEVDLGLPEALKLHGAFPNPSQGAVTLRYELPEATPVRLEVFNVLGQRVATLVDAEQEPGRKALRFTPRGLASGAYFVRLRAGDQLQTTRLVIVR